MLIPVLPSDDITLDIRYATADNLTRRPVYARPVALLLPEAHARLHHAAVLARPLGLRIKLFDAFRPIEAQWAFWHMVADKRFVADPSQGGVHPRGAAVDLTLTDRATGADLPMGTEFDAIDAASAHGSPDIPVADQRNRAILLGLMTAAGWDHYALEWWHYQLFDARRHPALSASAVPGGPM